VFGTVRYMAFFVMQVETRAVQIAGIRIAPDGEWMKQIARNLLDPEVGFLRKASHLTHDRDPVFTEARLREERRRLLGQHGFSARKYSIASPC
jgi:hypothetical protein